MIDAALPTREKEDTLEEPHMGPQIAKASSPHKRQMHALADAINYLVLFFLYWFGATRIDVDGDGSSHSEDAEADLEDHANLHTTSGRTRNSSDVRSNRPAENLIMEKAANQQETAAAQSANDTGGLHNVLDRDGDGCCTHTECTGVASVIIKIFEDTAVDADRIQPIPTTHQAFPYFMVSQIVVTCILWFASACVKATNEGSDWRYVQAGLDTMSEGTFTLTLSNGDCDDLRPQIWRWVTYQCTHVDLSHVVMNTFMNIILGVPLEFLHRWWRMAIMFNVGVLGGAFFYFVGDSHGVVVGCSGGCYALIGVHIADLLLNWKQKKFRIPTLFVLASVIGTAIVANCSSEDSGNTSTHFGGGVAGVCIGVLVGKRLYVVAHDRIIIAVFLIVGVFLSSFCISWTATQTGGPRNIFEAANGESGWCWYRQVWDNRLNPDAYECIRCGTKECIKQVSNFSIVIPVSWKECDDKGRWHD